MNIKSIVAAVAIAASSFGAFATTYSFNQGVAAFHNDTITNPSTSFSQDLDFTGLAAGTYNILGDISGSNLSFTSVTLNGTAWNLYANVKGKFIFGDIDYTGSTPFLLHVSGTKTLNAAANYTGSLTVTAVPEPETFAMLLAGLGLMGAIARRRNKANA